MRVRVQAGKNHEHYSTQERTSSDPTPCSSALISWSNSRTNAMYRGVRAEQVCATDDRRGARLEDKT